MSNIKDGHVAFFNTRKQPCLLMIVRNTCVLCHYSFHPSCQGHMSYVSLGNTSVVPMAQWIETLPRM